MHTIQFICAIVSTPTQKIYIESEMDAINFGRTEENEMSFVK